MANNVQIFIDGAFNGDPHPGNILLLDDGRIGLLESSRRWLTTTSLPLSRPCAPQGLFLKITIPRSHTSALVSSSIAV
jgi:hypothetical protein